MRAWQITGVGSPSDVMKLVEIPQPVAGPGEVVLKVQAAGVGMPDAFMCRSTYAFSPNLPFVPGQEICGTVVDVGAGVSVGLGERLMGVTSFYDGRGGLAQYTVANEATLFRVPDAMSSADASTFRIGYSTALIGLQRRGELRAGETVLVLGGGGGSGSTAIQIASALGARVIAVVSSPEKVTFCSGLGAEAVIDRTAVDVVATVNELTDGRGADLKDRLSNVNIARDIRINSGVVGRVRKRPGYDSCTESICCVSIRDVNTGDGRLDGVGNRDVE